MTYKSQLEKEQSVQVVEADVFDRMNETRELIAQRAYEIYQSRGGGDGFHENDWFTAEAEVLPKLEVDFDVTDNEVQLTAQVPGFDAKDLEVELGHRRAVVCGVHSNTNHAAYDGNKDRRVMSVVELPFDVDPVLAAARLENGTLHVVLPRAR